MSWFKRKKSAPVEEVAHKVPDVVAVIPTAPVVYRFQCIKGFYSPELKSEYFEGGVYSVRQGNTRLNLFVKQWVEEGKVRRGS